MTGLGALVRASHPEPAVAVTGVSTAFAVAAGHGPRAALLGAAVLAGQLSIGWGNDWLDRERDATAGRRDKPVAAGTLSPRLVLACALVSVAACVPLSLAAGWRGGLVHLLAVGSAWAYDLRLKATAASVVPYVVSFGLLPAFLVLTLPGTPTPPLWLMAGTALLGAGAHFANALPDLEDDLRTGVRGLPTRLGARGSRLAAVALVLGASAVLVAGPPGPVGVGGALVLLLVTALVAAGLAVGARRPGSRVPFLTILVVAGVDVAVLIARGGAVAG